MTMAEETKVEDIKIVTYRPEGQKREYSTFVEISSNPVEVSLKFCDLKPPNNAEELEKVKKEGKVIIPVNTEIVLTLGVAEALASTLKAQLDKIKEQIKKEDK